MKVSQSLSAALICIVVNPSMKHNALACIYQQRRFVNKHCNIAKPSYQRNMDVHCRNGKIVGNIKILELTDLWEGDDALDVGYRPLPLIFLHLHRLPFFIQINKV